MNKTEMRLLIKNEFSLKFSIFKTEEMFYLNK